MTVYILSEDTGYSLVLGVFQTYELAILAMHKVNEGRIILPMPYSGRGKRSLFSFEEESGQGYFYSLEPFTVQ